jgi:hypothetical protein
MRYIFALVLLLLGAPIFAQNYYIPDNNAAGGIANVIPFGASTAGGFSNCRMHVRATAAELGNLPNIITGLGLASSQTGSAHYDTLEIVMDHIPATQAFSTVFANNLTSSAITVLSVTDYTWNVTSNTWNEVGLQGLFPYNGVDDLVIEIITTGATAPGGMRRGTNQRIYSISSTGPAPPTGVSSSSATKFEVSMLTGRTSSHGVGCPGANGTPVHTLAGTAQVGTTLSYDLANGVPSSLALLIVGYASTTPFPIDLSVINMPGCFAYTDLVFSAGATLDPTGGTTLPFAVPATAVGFLFYSQYACLDPTANTFGFTTSNYCRTYTGN